jgi:glycosyltransferase involved in cell wall biosynthesis
MSMLAEGSHLEPDLKSRHAIPLQRNSLNMQGFDMGSSNLNHSQLITVIMPVYNGERYLEKAVRSVLAQSYPNFELILVDDCSSDQSTQIIEKYLPDQRVVYLRNTKNTGVASSRNRALEHAKGEFITFHDQDDLWLPNKLSLQMDALRQNPDVGLLHTRYARIDTEGELLPEYRSLCEQAFGNNRAETYVGDVFEEIFISNDIQPLTSIIPKKVLDEVGWFNPDLPGVDDYELWLRIAQRYPIGHLQTITGFWRMHGAQQSKQGYAMLLIRLKAMDTFLATYPDATKRVNREAYVQRMHSMNRGVANHYFHNLQDYKTAQHYFKKALGLKPNDVNSLVKLVYCSLPGQARNLLRHFKNTLRRSAIAEKSSPSQQRPK